MMQNIHIIHLQSTHINRLRSLPTSRHRPHQPPPPPEGLPRPDSLHAHPPHPPPPPTHIPIPAASTATSPRLRVGHHPPASTAASMPRRKTPKSNTGIFGVRAKPSGKFGAEFSHTGCRFWLNSYPTCDKVVHAYDVVVWHAERPKYNLNFPEIETRADAVILVSQGIRMEEIPTKKLKKRSTIVVRTGDSGEAAMLKFTRELPKYVQAEKEFFWKRDAEHKKKEEKKDEKMEDEAGPSTLIPIESSDEDDKEFSGLSDDDNEEYCIPSDNE